MGREDRETLEGTSEGAEKHPDPDLNPDSVPDPEPPHGEGVGVGSERKQGAKQPMVWLKAMFNRVATRADRMSRRAARLLGKPVTALKQFKGELLTKGRDIVEGLIRKASKSSPNQPNVSKATSPTPNYPQHIDIQLKEARSQEGIAGDIGPGPTVDSACTVPVIAGKDRPKCESIYTLPDPVELEGVHV